jgi:hypothetical protein
MKRKVTEKDAAPAAKGPAPTIGMLTSGIRNKVARSEAYGKLKHIKKVLAALHWSLTVPMAHVADSSETHRRQACVEAHLAAQLMINRSSWAAPDRYACRKRAAGRGRSGRRRR